MYIHIAYSNSQRKKEKNISFLPSISSLSPPQEQAKAKLGTQKASSSVFTHLNGGIVS